MTKFSLKSAVTGRTGAAALGGLLLTAAFPSLGLAWLAWIAPGMILFSALGTSGARAFRIGFAGGVAHFLSSLYWLLYMPLTWHGLPLAPCLGWLALSAYCALFPGIWAWLCWRIFPGPANLENFLALGWIKRSGWAFAAGAIWAALEFVRGTFLTGFPWNFVGASQFRVLPLIQIASVTGILGVSFLVVWTSVALAGVAAALTKRLTSVRLWAHAGLPLVVVMATGCWGFLQLVPPAVKTKELKVAMVQPGIPQTEIWDPSRDQARFETVLDLSKKALAQKPQLLLWPESAAPDLSQETQDAISQFVHANKVWLVFCAGTMEPAPSGGMAIYNSSLICGPDGSLGNIYHKRRLVIFGEYVPLVHWLPFLKFLTDIGDNIEPGERPVNFDMTDPSVKMSVLICFEDMFAQEAREHAGPGVDFLVNLTNDGWFGHASEQWQQAAGGIFRAVENGIPILRCTNDGITCWADAHGRVRQVLGEGRNVYAPGFMVADVPLRNPGNREQTIYNRFGDWFPIGCSMIGLVCLGSTFLRRNPPIVPLSKSCYGTAQN